MSLSLSTSATKHHTHGNHRRKCTFSSNMSAGTIDTLKVHQNSFEGEEASFRRPLTMAVFSIELKISAIVYRGRPICLFHLAHDVFLGTFNKEQQSDTALDEDKVTPRIALIFNPN